MLIGFAHADGIQGKKKRLQFLDCSNEEEKNRSKPYENKSFNLPVYTGGYNRELFIYYVLRNFCL